MITKEKIAKIRQAFRGSPHPYVGNLFEALDTIEVLEAKAKRYRKALEEIKRLGDKHHGEIGIAGDIAKQALDEKGGEK